jgi:type IV pilus assembly protein PilE
MNAAKRKSGLTLIEIVVVLAIVAVLAALAYPSYVQYAREARRGEAQQLLMNWSVNQEIWRSNNSTYADENDLAVPTHTKFTFTVPVHTATAYTVRAVAGGDQANDKEKGTTCTPLEINQSGFKSPATCWD